MQNVRLIPRSAFALVIVFGCTQAIAEGVLDDFPADGTWWKYEGSFSSGEIRGTHQAALRAIGNKALAGDAAARVFEVESIIDSQSLADSNVLALFATRRFHAALQLYLRNTPLQNFGLSVPEVLAGWYLADNQADPVVIEPVSGLQDYAQIPTIVLAVVHEISSDLSSGDAETIAARLAARWIPVEVTVADDEEFKVAGLEQPLVVRPIQIKGEFFQTKFTLNANWSDDVPFGLASLKLAADNEQQSQITLQLKETGQGRTSSTYPLIVKKLAQIEESASDDADKELRQSLELLLSTMAITDPDVPDAVYAAIGDVLLDHAVRSETLLAELGDSASERLLPVLFNRTQQGEMSERILAAELYLQMGGSVNRQLEEAVARGLTARTQSLRLRCAMMLAGHNLAADNPKVLQTLERDGLNQQTPKERVQVIEAIGRFGSGAKRLLPAITKAFNDEELSVRAAAVAAVGRVGADDPQTAPVLLGLLSDDEGEIRRAAFASLQDLSDLDGDLFRSEIRALVESDDSACRADGITFLAELDPSTPVLLQALEDPSSQVRAAAARALADGGQHASDVTTIRRLCELAVKDEYEDVRSAAQETLVKFAMDRRRAILNALRAITADDGLPGPQRVRAITVERMIREN